MKLIKLIKSSISNLFDQYSNLESIVNRIDKENGKAYLVGGAVRDILLGQSVTDMDIEVHGIEIDKLDMLLSEFGPVSFVGKSFGVLKIHGISIDWSLPRTDLEGRKPVVTVDPNMPIIEALRRRDLTMNAMAIDLKTLDFIDPFGGHNDITNKILRSPDTQFFTQDPLRFYRVMQFISRFEMFPDIALNEVCKFMDISNISIERIEAEFEKLALKSNQPSLGIRWIKKINRLNEVLPELNKTVGIEQDKDWHPEGDVFEHLMQSFDASIFSEYDNKHEKLIVMFAALCHDLGKITTTEFINGRIRSYGHSEAGMSFTKSLLKRITKKKDIINSVVLLVKYHMLPGQFINLNSSLAAYRRLALKLKGYANLDMLAKLALADVRGRNIDTLKPLDLKVKFVEEFINRAKLAQVLKEYVIQILHGRDIKDFIKPGPEMGKILKWAYKLQINSGINDKNKLLDAVIQEFKLNKSKKG